MNEIAEETTKGNEDFRSGFIAVLGRPNAGKSTLVNLLAGKKLSIVTPRPQTTRNRILAIINHPGAQLILVDTPGIAARRHKLDEHLIAAANAATDDADAAIVLVEAPKMKQDLRWTLDVIAKIAPIPCLLLVNKLDLMPPAWHQTNDAQVEDIPTNAELMYFSAKLGNFADELLAWCMGKLSSGLRFFPEGVATDHPEEWQAAELVREQVMLALHMEVPYAAAVTVEQYNRSDEKLMIRATIHIERESQKPIVIGAGGRKLKRIGIEARKEIARIMDLPTDLFLHVAVMPDWRNDPQALRNLGFDDG